MSNIPPLPPEPLDAIEETAAEWLALKAEGFTPQQEQHFARWLELDPRHPKVFRALEATWDIMGQAHPVSAKPAPVPVISFFRKPWPRTTLAVAAALVLGVGAWMYTAQLRSNVFVTEVGGLRKFTLPDGSLVTLNTDSEIKLGYTDSERRVALIRGEALFEVVKDKLHPFIVSASGVDFRAVGTAFNVRHRPEGVELTVSEGKVAIARPDPAASTDAQPVLLTAGQRTLVPLTPEAPPPTIVALPPPEMKQALAWQERRLEFEDTPLSLMVAELNRYNTTKLVIADPRLSSRTFGGSFPSGDYEAFVRLLEQNFGVIAERRSDEIRLLLP